MAASASASAFQSSGGSRTERKSETESASALVAFLAGQGDMEGGTPEQKQQLWNLFREFRATRMSQASSRGASFRWTPTSFMDVLTQAPPSSRLASHLANEGVRVLAFTLALLPTLA